MHFFGTLGVLAFFFGFVVAIWLIVDKLISISSGLAYRNVTDQPLFFLALVAIVVGVQLFMKGFLAEMLSRPASARSRYHIEIGRESCRTEYEGRCRSRCWAEK